MNAGHVQAGILQVVRNDRPFERLRIAAAHIEIAIAHINNAAQVRVPVTGDGKAGEVETLRLLVRALADIRDELRQMHGADVPEGRLA